MAEPYEPPEGDEEEEDDDGGLDEVDEDMMRQISGRQRCSVSAEAYGAWNQKQPFNPPYYQKEPGQEDALRNVLSRSFLFNGLEPDALATVIGAMQLCSAEPDQLVIRQGDDGDFLFIIEDGLLECYKRWRDVQSGEEVEALVASCGPGDAFGELALLYNCPRAASVIAREASLLWKLDRETFNHIVKGAAELRMAKLQSFIAKCPLLQGLSTYEQTKLTEALTRTDFADGSYIIRQGEVGGLMYFVESGCCIARKCVCPGETDEVVGTHGEGDYFGELALLTSEPCQASVIAHGPVTTLCVSHDTFQRLLGSLKERLSADADTRYGI